MDPLYNATDVNATTGTNGSGTGGGDGFNQFVQPAWQISLWAVAYCSIVAVSVLGNTVVVWIILAHKRMRTVTNYFLGKDCDTLCTVCLSQHNNHMFFLRILSLHRYYVCVTLLIYFLPLCIMGCAYTIVGVTLWASEIPGDSTEHYKKQMTAKRKVVKMLIVVVCTFAGCWLPYHIYFLLHQFFPDLFEQRYIQQVYLAVMWLAMSSTMYNPIIYYCLNSRFRAGFQQVFCCCVPTGAKEELQLKSRRYQHTQVSIYRASRAGTVVFSSNHPAEGEQRTSELPSCCPHTRPPVDVKSNGSEALTKSPDCPNSPSQ
ncbi:substance-P receptor-like [Etheostoma cragini]|uniref:substance-P receptor-like n=1 Tax=Etheostoma cragini TaxID=417921 RepID=UPI00155F3C69|nr:substance-P receptor-like [Etheostoma cragini]